MHRVRKAENTRLVRLYCTRLTKLDVFFHVKFIRHVFKFQVLCAKAAINAASLTTLAGRAREVALQMTSVSPDYTADISESREMQK